MCKLHGVFQAHPNTVVDKDISTEIPAQALTLKGPCQVGMAVLGKVRYETTQSDRFLSYRAIQAEILARLAVLSTLSVATMRAQSSESARHREERTVL